MAQESAAWTIQGLLCRSPPPTPKFCAEVLSHNPELIDLLFQCALFPRPPWYPESQVDSISCESLAMLFRVPPETIPGISINLENDFQGAIEEDKKGVTDSLKILTARPKWTEKIIAVWNKIDNEKIHELKKYTILTIFSVSASTDPILGCIERSRRNTLLRLPQIRSPFWQPSNIEVSQTVKHCYKFDRTQQGHVVSVC